MIVHIKIKAWKIYNKIFIDCMLTAISEKQIGEICLYEDPTAEKCVYEIWYNQHDEYRQVCCSTTR